MGSFCFHSRAGLDGGGGRGGDDGEAVRNGDGDRAETGEQRFSRPGREGREQQAKYRKRDVKPAPCRHVRRRGRA